ncbi:MAG: carbohydrate kinase [Gammaproteobacteria bacterium]|nr:carbohydrate kinase [Gammaproteobacteria bacterium]
MNDHKQVVIFGEVLFDCFATEEQILGGAPFNVAWHLNAFGDDPKFISRVGDDQQGHTIVKAMTDWGMDTNYIQVDNQYPTGRVDVTVIDNEPHYDIVSNVAYDFIEHIHKPNFLGTGLIYHGSLALRNQHANHAFEHLLEHTSLPVFVDVNLRPPWWNKHKIEQCLYRATWAKLNKDELGLIGFNQADIKLAIAQLQREFQLDQVIITRGELGALVCTKNHQFHNVKPPDVNKFVDTVGAGDAFTARYIHGLVSDEAIDDTIDAAQKFAIKVIGLRGAISTDPDFYKDFIVV